LQCDKESLLFSTSVRWFHCVDKFHRVSGWIQVIETLFYKETRWIMVFGTAFEVPTSAFWISRPKGDITVHKQQKDPNKRNIKAGANIVSFHLPNAITITEHNWKDHKQHEKGGSPNYGKVLLSKNTMLGFARCTKCLHKKEWLFCLLFVFPHLPSEFHDPTDITVHKQQKDLNKRKKMLVSTSSRPCHLQHNNWHNWRACMQQEK
jgi:hypothetical protein